MIGELGKDLNRRLGEERDLSNMSDLKIDHC